MRRICLVTATSVAHDPRLLKVADSLHAAGHAVRVASCQNLAWVAAYDERLMAGRGWRLEAVAMTRRGAAGWLRHRRAWLRNQLCRRALGRATLGVGVAERAYTLAYPELRALAAREPADLYIAHALRALPAAAHAAARHGARLAFDAEDLHTGELHAGRRGELAQRLAEHIEAAYIGRCAFVSAPSGPVADELARRYGLPRPLVVHNAFPLADRRPPAEPPRDRRGPALSLYWYSQTIGADRGIQDAIRAAGLIGAPVQIHLRGSLAPAVAAELAELARRCGLDGRLFFHPQAPPEELPALAAEHDVGLALEPGLAHSLNNALTVSNKLFAYLLAGLAVAASDTPGQRSVLAGEPRAGFLYPPGDYQALAAGLREWAARPAALAAARAAAIDAARTRWCWEIEAPPLLERIAAAAGAA